MPDVTDRLKAGHTIGDRTYKVHIDGFNFLPYLTGDESRGPRPCFFYKYFSDDGDMLALRYDNWKLVFAEQRARGTLELWAEPFIRLRVPKLFNLRTDPYEGADANTYYVWLIDHVFLMIPAQALVGEFLTTFKEFPPRQKAASFTIDQVLAKLLEPGGG